MRRMCGVDGELPVDWRSLSCSRRARFWSTRAWLVWAPEVRDWERPLICTTLGRRGLSVFSRLHFFADGFLAAESGSYGSNRLSDAGSNSIPPPPCSLWRERVELSFVRTTELRTIRSSGSMDTSRDQSAQRSHRISLSFRAVSV